MLPGRFVQGYAVSIGYEYAYLYYNNQPIESTWAKNEQELEQKLQNLIYEYLPSWHYADQEVHPNPRTQIMYRQVAAA